jgi:hypothetical protein
MYQLGFVFLELIFSSFSDDNLGAEKARGILGMLCIYACMYLYVCAFICN